MKQRFLVVFEHRTTGYAGFAPDLRGCMAEGSGLNEMQKNMAEAMEAHIATLVSRGEQVPQAKTTIVHFPHPSEGHGIDHWVVESIKVEDPGAGQARRGLASDV